MKLRHLLLSIITGTVAPAAVSLDTKSLDKKYLDKKFPISKLKTRFTPMFLCMAQAGEAGTGNIWISC